MLLRSLKEILIILVTFLDSWSCFFDLAFSFDSSTPGLPSTGLQRLEGLRLQRMGRGRSVVVAVASNCDGSNMKQC